MGAQVRTLRPRGLFSFCPILKQPLHRPSLKMAGLIMFRNIYNGLRSEQNLVQQSGPGPPHSIGLPRTENKMLRLHESLSESLYQNKDDRSNEKLSVKIVFLLTLLGCLLPLSWSQNDDFLHSVLLPLLYATIVWLLPCCSFVMGVKKRHPRHPPRGQLPRRRGHHRRGRHHPLRPLRGPSPSCSCPLSLSRVGRQQW